MTVSDLIAELSRMPGHCEVRIFVPMVYAVECGMTEIMLSKDCDFGIADRVRFEGNHVMIEGRA